MKTNDSYLYHELQNGIRIVFKHSDSEVVHVGLFINAGSRDEQDGENGIAHFIEHVIFKGTQHRTSAQIYDAIECAGGELNAFTTKEDTCIHASFLKQHFESSSELISDVAFNSTFPTNEINKEKEIIIDEIFYYKDIPEETIFEDFEEVLFAGHPLGQNILGKPEKIRSFTRANIKAFINRHYATEKMVISIVGNLDFTTVKKILDKHFGHASIGANTLSQREPFVCHKKVIKVYKKKIFQHHHIMGNVAYSYHDKRKLGLTLLNNILGGPASNSWLNMSVREKHGLTYNIESNYTPYEDTGIFSIYVSMDSEVADKALLLIEKELRKMCDKKLSSIALHKAKEQLKGNLALVFESRLAEMLSIGKTYLIFDKVDSISQIIKKIDKLNSVDLFTIANEVLPINNFTQVIYKSNGSYRG